MMTTTTVLRRLYCMQVATIEINSDNHAIAVTGRRSDGNRRGDGWEKAITGRTGNPNHGRIPYGMHARSRQ